MDDAGEDFENPLELGPNFMNDDIDTHIETENENCDTCHKLAQQIINNGNEEFLNGSSVLPFGCTVPVPEVHHDTLIEQLHA